MIKNMFNWDYANLNLPSYCPVCNASLEILENGEIRCINESCPQKISHLIANFFTILDIKGAGPAFYDTASKDCTSLYSFLTLVQDISNCKKWAGGINGIKIQKAIQKKLINPISIEQYLALFDLEGFSVKKLALLKDTVFYKNFEQILFSKEKLYEVCSNGNEYFPEITQGISTTQKEILYQKIKEKIADIEFCKKFFNFTKEHNKVVTQSKGILSGLSFCFTGKAEAIGTRAQCEQLVIENGGTISSVKKGLSYLVTDDITSGSSKNKKAQSLGISIINSYEFQHMLIQEG